MTRPSRDQDIQALVPRLVELGVTRAGQGWLLGLSVRRVRRAAQGLSVGPLTQDQRTRVDLLQRICRALEPWDDARTWLARPNAADRFAERSPLELAVLFGIPALVVIDQVLTNVAASDTDGAVQELVRDLNALATDQ
ncbi:hypothetical protein ACMT4L_19875 [Deinococcus sp. A31D244]|uniref:hypothetical protein n=1 Tax=Deinococcus sp. A31D244 TaxID=3397675 RepID=UPI0039E070FF